MIAATVFDSINAGQVFGSSAPSGTNRSTAADIVNTIIGAAAQVGIAYANRDNVATPGFTPTGLPVGAIGLPGGGVSPASSIVSYQPGTGRPIARLADGSLVFADTGEAVNQMSAAPWLLIGGAVLLAIIAFRK